MFNSCRYILPLCCLDVDTLVCCPDVVVCYLNVIICYMDGVYVILMLFNGTLGTI